MAGQIRPLPDPCPSPLSREPLTARGLCPSAGSWVGPLPRAGGDTPSSESPSLGSWEGAGVPSRTEGASWSALACRRNRPGQKGRGRSRREMLCEEQSVCRLFVLTSILLQTDYCILQCSTVYCGAIQYSPVHTAHYSTAKCSTVKYRRVPWRTPRRGMHAARLPPRSTMTALSTETASRA